MPAKFLFERIFQLLVSLLIKSFQLEFLSIQKNSSLPPLSPNIRRRLFSPSIFALPRCISFLLKCRGNENHRCARHVDREGGEREGGRWSRCGASEGRRRGRRRKEWGVGRVVSYLGSVVAGSGEGCQVRRVAARVETRERSSEIPSRDIGHSLTRPPTALGPSRNTLACCLPGWLLACLPACLLACLAG